MRRPPTAEGGRLAAAVQKETAKALPASMAAAAAATTKAVLSGVAPSTRKAYEAGFVRYESFCLRHDTPPLPTKPAVLAAFLTDTMTARKTYGSVTSATAAVGFAHRACGFPPLAEGQWRLVLKGARNQLQKNVVRRQVLTPQMLAEVLAYTQADVQAEQQIQRGICIALGYFAGARFSDLDATLMKDMVFTTDGVHIAPTGKRKNDSTNKKSEHRRNLFAARVGGKNCIVRIIETHMKRFGWSGDTKLMPSKYDSYLRQYRGILRAACNISAAQAKRFGTHSGRRTAATVSRSSGDAPSALRAFAGVSSTSWDDTYADSLVPQERKDVAGTLARAVKGHRARNDNNKKNKPATPAKKMKNKIKKTEIKKAVADKRRSAQAEGGACWAPPMKRRLVRHSN